MPAPLPCLLGPVPGQQAAHRALSLAAVGFLATHVLMEVLAHRSRPADAVAPFLASGRTLYLGLGTLASDLVLVILATGVARRRFAGWPATWRVMHVTAYLAWPLAMPSLTPTMSMPLRRRRW